MKIFRIKYQVDENRKFVQILSPDFVMINKNSSKIIFNNKLLPIKEYVEIKNKDIKIIKLFLINYNDICKINIDFMFKECFSLLEVCEIKNGIKYNQYKKYDYSPPSSYNIFEDKTNIINSYYGYKLSDFSKIYDEKSKIITNSLIFCGHSLLSNLLEYNWNINSIIIFKNNSKKLENKIDEFNKNNKRNNESKSEHSFIEYIQMYKMVYKVFNYGEKIKIFGQNFVKNNKNKCLIIFEDKIYSLKEYFLVNIEFKNDLNKKIELKLLEIKNINDKSYMFHNCTKLEEFHIINDFKENINEEIYKFDSSYDDSENDDDIYNSYIKLKEKEIKLIKIRTSNNNPTISFYTNNLSMNLTDITSMFNGCKSLKFLPDISNLNTNKIINMSYIFNDCESLISLPDLSKWDTTNVNNMSYLFSNCCNIIRLPDISNWDTKNVNDMTAIFQGCNSLVSLPDISNWDMKNVTNISYMLNQCSTLSFLPNISKWKTFKINDMNSIFSECSNLSSLPDI